MKKLSKITIGLIIVTSICSCSKGTKTTKEKFVEKIGNIDFKDNYKKAKLTYVNSEITKGTNIEPEKKGLKCSGIYVKENGSWANGSDKNDIKADSQFMYFLNYVHLSCFDEFFFEDTLSDTEVKYYVNPFSLDWTYKSEDKDHGYKSSQEIHECYEWDNYGYVTYFLHEEEYKESYSNNEIHSSRYTKIIVVYN